MRVVQLCGIAHAESPYGTVTISVGVATLASDLLRRENAAESPVAGADESLYRAMAGGRNRIARATAPDERPIAVDAPAPADLATLRV